MGLLCSLLFPNTGEHPVKVTSTLQQVTLREGTVVNAVLLPCLGHKLARSGGVTPGLRPQHASYWCHKEAKTCSANAACLLCRQVLGVM